jgi:pimeloyl-ACP methyl ester carboxylesterase
MLVVLAAVLGCSTVEPAATSEAPKVSVKVVPAAPAVGAAPVAAPPVQAQHTVEVDGHPIAVWEKSAPSPQGTIVLVHGRTWSGRPDFDLQVPGESRSLMDALVAAGYATYAVDLRGYGGTPRDETQWLTPDRAEADVAAVVEWVRTQRPEPPKVALVGWSLGSLVSQLVAQRHPEELSAVVLYGYPRDPDRTYPPDPEVEVAPPRKATTAKAAAEDFRIPGSISQAAIDAFVQQALAADPVRMDWRAADQWNALDPAQVRVPTLVIHGEQDPYAPVAAQSKLFARLGTPDRAWVIVAGGDHAAHLEDVGPRFVAAVTSFLQRP